MIIIVLLLYHFTHYISYGKKQYMKQKLEGGISSSSVFYTCRPQVGHNEIDESFQTIKFIIIVILTFLLNCIIENIFMENWIKKWYERMAN